MRDDWAGLVARAKEGDPEAFAELVERFKRPMCAVIYPIVRDWHLTQDVAQDSFVAAFERLGDLRDSRHFRAWLFSIAKNRAMSRARRAGRQRARSMQSMSEEDVYDLMPDPAEPAETEEGGPRPSPATMEKVRQVLLSLPNGYGSILLMHHVEGMRLAEMSDVLGRSQKAVKAVLYRARLLARQYLKLSGLDYRRVFDEL